MDNLKKEMLSLDLASYFFLKKKKLVAKEKKKKHHQLYIFFFKEKKMKIWPCWNKNQSCLTVFKLNVCEPGPEFLVKVQAIKEVIAID